MRQFERTLNFIQQGEDPGKPGDSLRARQTLGRPAVFTLKHFSIDWSKHFSQQLIPGFVFQKERARALLGSLGSRALARSETPWVRKCGYLCNRDIWS